MILKPSHDVGPERAYIYSERQLQLRQQREHADEPERKSYTWDFENWLTQLVVPGTGTEASA